VTKEPNNFSFFIVGDGGGGGADTTLASSMHCLKVEQYFHPRSYYYIEQCFFIKFILFAFLRLDYRLTHMTKVLIFYKGLVSLVVLYVQQEFSKFLIFHFGAHCSVQYKLIYVVEPKLKTNNIAASWTNLSSFFLSICYGLSVIVSYITVYVTVHMSFICIQRATHYQPV
jgi:hypothetical protein